MIFLEIFENFTFFKRKSFEGRLMNLAQPVSSTSPSGGNQVDGLPPASSTETVAKPDRLGPAQNGELTQLLRVIAILNYEVYEEARKPCQAYVEDQYKCVQM